MKKLGQHEFELLHKFLRETGEVWPAFMNADFTCRCSRYVVKFGDDDKHGEHFLPLLEGFLEGKRGCWGPCLRYAVFGAN